MPTGVQIVFLSMIVGFIAFFLFHTLFGTMVGGTGGGLVISIPSRSTY